MDDAVKARPTTRVDLSVMRRDRRSRAAGVGNDALERAKAWSPSQGPSPARLSKHRATDPVRPRMEDAAMKPQTFAIDIWIDDMPDVICSPAEVLCG